MSTRYIINDELSLTQASHDDQSPPPPSSSWSTSPSKYSSSDTWPSSSLGCCYYRCESSRGSTRGSAVIPNKPESGMWSSTSTLGSSTLLPACLLSSSRHYAPAASDTVSPAMGWRWWGWRTACAYGARSVVAVAVDVSSWPIGNAWRALACPASETNEGPSPGSASPLPPPTSA